ncbi:UDP-4-amino-4,6-dideoxy-N-acetyl-beta-L-altrosamine N-acetyltransferase [Pseudomonas sp. HLS-6 TE3448]
MTVIRAMTTGDLEMVLQWRNHPDVRRYMYTQHEISLDEHRRWFESSQCNAARHLLIFEQLSVPLGFVSITEGTPGRIADWGFYLAPEAPRGTGRSLGQAALEFAFVSLRLHKVCGQALGFNERSIRFHHALGFIQEGVLRDQHFDGENYQSVIHFGLLREEWQALQPEA